MLHVTNGDITAELMRKGGVRGEILPWRDVLHEGPVPMTGSLEELSAIRTRYLADCGYGEAANIAAEFRNRDAALARFVDHEEVVLWFEHDLYDQLQLLQVLDFLGKPAPQVPVSLIVVGSYPGIEQFVGLGQLAPRQLAGLQDTRLDATAEHFVAAGAAWAAFRMPTPVRFAGLLQSDSPALAYLHGAVLRLLEELPSAGNGLSRTERVVLGLVAQGVDRPGEIFSQFQVHEPRPFMGDWSFWRIVRELASGQPPLLAVAGGGEFASPPHLTNGSAFESQRLEITGAGREVLHNHRDAIKLRGIDRWLGGTRLKPGTVWRWDEETQRLLQP